jgi:hypothetical protein
MRNRWPILLLLSLPVLAGCGANSQPLAAVTGRLTLNGRPLKGATVVFTPDRAQGGRGPQSFDVTAEDGTFTLRTMDGPGAVAGWHLVTVAPPADDARLTAQMEKFRDPEQSGLSREVKAGVANAMELSLEISP